MCVSPLQLPKHPAGTNKKNKDTNSCLQLNLVYFSTLCVYACKCALTLLCTFFCCCGCDVQEYRARASMWLKNKLFCTKWTKWNELGNSVYWKGSEVWKVNQWRCTIEKQKGKTYLSEIWVKAYIPNSFFLGTCSAYLLYKYLIRESHGSKSVFSFM